MQLFKSHTDATIASSAMNKTARESQASRNMAFAKALQERLDDAEFCFAFGVMSRDISGWYYSGRPYLATDTGVTLSLTYKPMAADRLFWEMVGLSTKKKDTLEFRNRGLWTLRSPNFVERHGEGIKDVDALADIAVKRTQDWCELYRNRLSLTDMLKGLGPYEHLSEDERILAICLSVLQKDFEAAHLLATLNRTDSDKDRTTTPDYSFVRANGDKSTLMDKAIPWLISKRRESLKLVN